MRILVVSNFYPPVAFGGQERSCQQVVEGLKQRGHQIQIVTSTVGRDRVAGEAEGIDRTLYLEVDPAPWRHSIDFFTRRAQRLQHNLRRLRQSIVQFEPDLVFVWGMWNLSRHLPALAEAHCPGRVVYRFADYWPTLPNPHHNYWTTPSRTWFSRIPKLLLRSVALSLLEREPPPPDLSLAHSFCVSAAVRETLLAAGVPVENSRVIYPGIDRRPFHGRPRTVRRAESALRLLFIGRLVPEKGVEVMLRALSRLVNEHGLDNLRLNIAGSDASAYGRYLHQLAERQGIKRCVSFLGQVPGERLPALLYASDVLVVPSVWQEPFPRVVLEGMAAGLPVIASATGGSQEAIVDGENGLLFPAGADAELADRLAALCANPKLRRRLAAAGPRTVAERFTFSRMIDNIEDYLLEVLVGARRSSALAPVRL